MRSHWKSTTLFIASLLCAVCVSQTRTPVPVTPRSAAARASKSAGTTPVSVQSRAGIPAAAAPGLLPAQSGQQNTPQPQSSPVGAQPAGIAEVPKTTSPGALAIDYRNGEVTVVAEKAELGKVLELLGKKIGTSIEVAPDVARDPVVAHLGPVTPTQALAQLLDGPTLEYIVMGSDDSGHLLQRVVVRRRNSFAREPLVAVKAGAATAQQRNASGR